MRKDYDELFASVPCGILQFELPFGNPCRIYKINPKAMEIMKICPGEKYLEPEMYLDEDNLKYAREILARMKKQGDKSSFLLKTHHSAIEGDAERIVVENGHEVVQCMFVEVGGEIESRRREAQQREVLERVLNSVRCGIFRFTFEDDEQKITLVNPAGWKMLGFETEEECLHKSITDILPRIHPEDRVEVLKKHCSLTRENDRNECEFRVKDGNGGYMWLDAVQQSLRDAKGNHLIQMTLTDITQQHELMQRKKEEDGQIIHSLGSIYFTILQVDAKRDWYQVVKDERNREEAGNTGCYSEKLKEWIADWTGNRMTSPKTENLSLEYFRKLYSQGKTSWEQDYRQNTKNAEKQSYIRVALVLTGEDEELHYVTVAARDITELHEKEMREKEALRSACEASRQASRAKTEFLSNMSHDIRTPMNAITGFTQIMERHLNSPEVLKENIRKIKKSTQILLELINDVLDVSRIESGKVVLDEQPVNMKDLVEEVEELIWPSAKEHRHELQTKCMLSEEIFTGDSLRIKQILLNLLSNAVKFTPDGGHILFSAWEEPDANVKYKNIHFRIQDDGIGMTPEFQKHIFEPFERAPETEKMQGTGLGMTITHNLLRLMNGMIQISSEYGKGSCFDVIIPLRIAEPGVRPLMEEKNSGETPNLKGKNILIVEDNEINMEIASMFLEETGASLEKASDGREAVEMFQQSEPGHYSVILMDVQMPVMDGYEATKRIRKSKHPDAEQIPIIAMTANAFSEDIFAAHQAGMNEHLSKPMEMEKLYKVLKRWVKPLQNIGKKTEIMS